MKTRTVTAALFWVAAIFLCYWFYSRGGFSPKTVEFPVRLQDGTVVSLPFSVRERGDHDVEIQYLQGSFERLLSCNGVAYCLQSLCSSTSRTLDMPKWLKYSAKVQFINSDKSGRHGDKSQVGTCIAHHLRR
jgi:hypothetical protein